MKEFIPINLKNKVVLITGGYGYLGNGIVRNLLGHGATVYVLARSQEKFNLAFSDLLSDNLKFINCDIEIVESIDLAIKSVFNIEGVIDCIINNAFYTKGQSPEEMSEEDFMTGLDGTLRAGYSIIKSVIPLYKKQQFGKIINVASMYGVVSPDFTLYDKLPQFLNPPHYGAAKAGLIQLTKYYSAYLGKYNITVNAVSPGSFPSKQVMDNKEFIQGLSERTVLNRVGKPKDLGGVFTFLCSDASDYITGQNIKVDGGWTIR